MKRCLPVRDCFVVVLSCRHLPVKHQRSLSSVAGALSGAMSARRVGVAEITCVGIAAILDHLINRINRHIMCGCNWHCNWHMTSNNPMCGTVGVTAIIPSGGDLNKSTTKSLKQ